jgi:hypothetical protein
MFNPCAHKLCKHDIDHRINIIASNTMFTYDGTEVCRRMNHYIIGGVGDGDSGEDGGDEQRGARAVVAAARGTPPPPASWGSAAP